MKTKTEIETEINALKACKAYAPKMNFFGDNNHRKIDLQIEYLQGEIDTTADEFFDFSGDEQESVLDAERWKSGDCDESPSSGWDAFKK